MENENSGLPSINGVSAPAPDSSPESNSQQDPTKNLKAEFNRKFSKINEKLDQLINGAVQSHRQAAPAEDADDAPEYKQYVNSKFVEQGQKEAWNKALELFPELNQESESFDENFYKAADKYYSSFDLKRDADAPFKAAKLAAIDLGKIEQLAKEKLYKDEARRSRILSEGSSKPRENLKEKTLEVKDHIVKRLGIDPEKLKARIKANKDKYGE